MRNRNYWQPPCETVRRLQRSVRAFEKETSLNQPDSCGELLQITTDAMQIVDPLILSYSLERLDDGLELLSTEISSYPWFET